MPAYLYLAADIYETLLDESQNETAAIILYGSSLVIFRYPYYDH